MTRRSMAILVALGGLVLLAAVLLLRRSEPVAPRTPAPRVVRPPTPSPVEDESARSAMTESIRRAQEELLVLCAKRDQLLKTKRDLEQAARDERTLLDKRAAADEHYRLAERYFQAVDYEHASEQCQKAIETHPEHLPARALLQEIQFILRKGKASRTPR